MNILGISGSLRTASVSTALLKAASTCMPGHVKLTIYDGLGNLPHFNPEIDKEFQPTPVSSLALGPSRSPGEDNDAQLFAQTRTLRIRQMDGFELSTD